MNEIHYIIVGYLLSCVGLFVLSWMLSARWYKRSARKEALEWEKQLEELESDPASEQDPYLRTINKH